MDLEFTAGSMVALLFGGVQQEGLRYERRSRVSKPQKLEQLDGVLNMGFLWKGGGKKRGKIIAFPPLPVPERIFFPLTLVRKERLNSTSHRPIIQVLIVDKVLQEPLLKQELILMYSMAPHPIQYKIELRMIHILRPGIFTPWISAVLVRYPRAR